MGDKDKFEPTEEQIKAVEPGIRKFYEEFAKLSESAQETLRDDILTQGAKEQFEKSFKSADKDGDGLLSREEYAEYLRLMADYQKEKAGESIEWSEEDIDFIYKSLNSLYPSTEGIAIDDFEKGQIIYAMEASK